METTSQKVKIYYLPDEQQERRDRKKRKRHLEAAIAMVLRGVYENRAKGASQTFNV